LTLNLLRNGGQFLKIFHKSPRLIEIRRIEAQSDAFV
jgi:hypothetical protein